MRKQKEKQNKRIKNLKSYSQDFYEVRQQALQGREKRGNTFTKEQCKGENE